MQQDDGTSASLFHPQEDGPTSHDAAFSICSSPHPNIHTVTSLSAVVLDLLLFLGRLPTAGWPQYECVRELYFRWAGAWRVRLSHRHTNSYCSCREALPDMSCTRTWLPLLAITRDTGSSTPIEHAQRCVRCHTTPIAPTARAGQVLSLPLVLSSRLSFRVLGLSLRRTLSLCALSFVSACLLPVFGKAFSRFFSTGFF